jgi:AcrR family transcriptional regulator
VAHVPAEERRAQLVDAAIRVIAGEGVARATTRRIAEEAGAPLAALHYTFRSKEELFSAVTEESVRLTEQALTDRGITPGVGLQVATTQILELFRDWTRADPGRQIAQFELQTWALRTPGQEGLARRCHELYEEVLAGLLSVAAREDEHVDPRGLARLVIVASDGMAWRTLSSGPASMADVDCARLAHGLIAAV